MFVNDYFYKAFIKQTCLVFRFYPVVPLIHLWGVGLRGKKCITDLESLKKKK